MEISENNLNCNFINEEDNAIDKLMENLNIKEIDNIGENISNKEDISHLPLLKSIGKIIINSGKLFK